MPLTFGGPGVSAFNKLGFAEISLASGQTYLIQPAGWYELMLGPYTVLQYYDPVLGTWRTVGGGNGYGSGGVEYLYSDGENFRLANLTGCAVGAIVTNHGSAYTSAPTVTASAGSSVWRAVLGGMVNTTVTVSNGGSNYTYPPSVEFSAPPAGGIQATGHATLSGGAVASIVVDNQGGGYASPPTIALINDPREGINGVTQGSGAAAVCTLTGAGQIAGVICVDPGVGGQTSTPTLSFSGGGGSSAAATALMCYTITAVTANTTGSSYTADVLAYIVDKITASTTNTNPAIEKQWVKDRAAQILLPQSGGIPTGTGAVIKDGGIFTNTSPDEFFLTNGAGSGLALSALTMGGTTDTSYISS
jgi:hypothetical protein